VLKSRAWLACARTTTAAPPPTPSTWSESVGHFWSSASCSSDPSAFHRPALRPAGCEPQCPRPAPARAGGGGGVRRRKLPPPAASRVYELTEWGKELEPVIIQLRRWGARSPSKPRDAALGVDSLILSFRTMFDPHAANGLSATYELRLDEDVFRAVVTRPFEIVRGSAERSHTTIETDADTLATLVYDGRELAEAMCSGDVKIVRATSRRWSASLRSSPFPSRPHPLPARSTARPARVASSRCSACLGGRRSTAQKPIGKGCRASRLRQLSGKRRAG
jgi:hypothetical protein